MQSEILVARLEAHVPLLRELLEKVDPRHAAWRPSSDAWSIVEIAAHLLDEETDDFRTRVELTLSDPAADWPPIDPQGWVTQREYAKRDLEETAETFIFERAVSVAWLRGLTSPQWTHVHEHPLGPLRAGDLLASWVAHDLLHIRQLVQRQWQIAESLARPFSMRYAGDW